MAEYKVKFEVFEGPLDLLLYLIKKEEVDIYEVNLTKLATQFIEYIETMRLLDLEIAGEFLVMAATLMYIKSRELLPVDKQVQVDSEEDEEDPRWELIRQLVAYKKFKDAAAQLQVLEVRQEDVFPRLPGKLEFPAEAPAKHEASLFDLINAVSAVLKRFNERDDLREIYEEKWSVSEKIQSLMHELSERPSFRFRDLFAQASSRMEIVVTFLALLELVRLKQLTAVQDDAFGEINICRVAPSTDSPAPEGAQTEAAAEAPGSTPPPPMGAQDPEVGASSSPPSPPEEEREREPLPGHTISAQLPDTKADAPASEAPAREGPEPEPPGASSLSA